MLNCLLRLPWTKIRYSSLSFGVFKHSMVTEPDLLMGILVTELTSGTIRAPRPGGTS